jgi:prophage regulatory protein
VDQIQGGIRKQPAVLKFSGMSISALRCAILRGDFPAPVKLGPRAVGWRESDLQRWLANLEPTSVLQPASPEPANGGQLPQPEGQLQGSPLSESEGQQQ